MGEKMIPISEAKGRLAEVVRDAADAEVALLRHGRPVAYVVGVERYEALIEQLEDVSDKLALYEPSGVTMSYDKLAAELGLDD